MKGPQIGKSPQRYSGAGGSFRFDGRCSRKNGRWTQNPADDEEGDDLESHGETKLGGVCRQFRSSQADVYSILRVLGFGL